MPVGRGARCRGVPVAAYRECPKLAVAPGDAGKHRLDQIAFALRQQSHFVDDRQIGAGRVAARLVGIQEVNARSVRADDDAGLRRLAHVDGQPGRFGRVADGHPQLARGQMRSALHGL